jgi:hypothetical protein
MRAEFQAEVADLRNEIARASGKTKSNDSDGSGAE